MSPVRVLPLVFLAAASGLSGQILISGSGGLANETYASAIDTTGGKSLGLAFQIEYLVVGGGGGGAGSGNDSSAWGGGGGGAGGMRTGSFNLFSTSADNIFAVTVGAGGAGGARSDTLSLQQGGNGGNSVLGSVTAAGGGGGGAYKVVGNSGGSGGGGGGRGNGNNLRTSGGAGTSGQGFAGGASRDDDSAGRSAGGGGGGAGGLGDQGGTDVSNGGNGGLGLASSITGSSLFYAAGGGGGAIDTNSGAGETAGAGGSGIGGSGSTVGNGSAGAANTGSGGGGVGHQGAGGAGGSGVVIVRYKGSSAASGAIAGTGTSTGYSVHTFSTTGNASLNFSSLNQDARLGSVVSSDISGSGALTINTLGTIRYTGNASHTGGTVIADGTLQLGTGGTEGSLSGDVTLAGGAVLEYNRSADATFSSLSGSGDLTKKGAGRLAIGGSGGYTGKVTLSAGTLALGSSSALGAGTLDIAAGATLASDGSSARSLSRDINLLGNATLGSATDTGALAVSGAVSLGGARTLTVASDVALSGVVSSGGLTKAGAGKLTLSGANTYVGNTAVTAGTLVIAGSVSTSVLSVSNGATAQVGSGGTSGSLGTANVGLANGATLIFDRSDDTVIGNALFGGYNASLQRAEIVKQGSGKLTLSGAKDFYGRFDVRQGELIVDRGSASAGDFVWANISEGASYTMLNGFPNQNGGYFSAILNTSGAGQLVVKGTNRFSAYSSVLSSSLAHTGGTVIDGAGLLLSGENALAQGSSLTVRGGGILSSGSYSLGSVTIENGFLVPNYLTAASLQVDAGVFTGRLLGATPLVKSGSGEFRLSSYIAGRTGANRIEGGILVATHEASLGQGTTTVAGGSLRFRIGAFSTARMSTLVLDGGAVDLDGADIGTRYLDAGILDLRSGTIAMQLEGKGALTKTTAGTVTLGGDNARYAGNVTVSAGILRLLTTTSLGTASTVLLEGGTIELAGNTRVGYFEQTGGTITGGTLLSSLVLTESGTLGSVLADSGGASGILKRTAGTTQVTAANTFTGTIKVQQGLLQLDGAGAFASAAKLVTSTGGTLDLAGKAQTLSGISGDGAIALGTGGSLTVSSASSSIFDGSIGGAGTLVKSGTGTLRLNGAAAHTGGTSVTGGTLVVNGTLGAGALTVASGTTLGGSGTIAGATVISGTHSPGNSPGLQTFTSSLTYQSGAEVRWELAGQSELESDRGVVFDGIDVTGDLTFAGQTNLLLAMNLAGSSVDWADSFWASGRSWKLYDVGGAVTGFNNLSIAVASGMLDSLGVSLATARDGALFTVNLRSGDVFIDYIAPAPIPEPSTYGLAFGLLALASVAVRRRAQRPGTES